MHSNTDTDTEIPTEQCHTDTDTGKGGGMETVCNSSLFTLSLLINNLRLLSYTRAHRADSMAEASINMLHQHY